MGGALGDGRRGEVVTIASDDVWFLEVEGRRVDLRAGEVTIGRSRGCGVVLRDPSVSRGHALLSVGGGRVTLQDLRSSNGTYVNGRRIDAETPLAEGDRVVIGETALYLRRSADGAARPPAASEGAVFCPACGRPVEGESTGCPSCGAALRGARLPRRSEALGLGEVLPVGEVLGAGSASWEQTTFRPGAARAASSDSSEPDAAGAAPEESAEPAASSRSTPPTAYPPPVAEPATEAPSLAELPMSVREAERAPAAPPEGEAPPAPPPPGLLQRLAERLGLGGRRG
jgi:FHA domain-containing protein